MARYKLVEEDLTVGAELLCIWRHVIIDDSYTVGECYKVVDYCAHGYWQYRISRDDGQSEIFSMDELNDTEYYEVVFVPVNLLSGKEMFLYKMTGNLPERFHETC